MGHRQTLILPAEANPGAGFFEVGALCRREAAERIVGYSFNLETNDLVPRTAPNPNAGMEHQFRAWRVTSSATDPVSMRNVHGEPLVVEPE